MGHGDGERRLILFDIDGTLIHTGGAGTRAMTRAFAEACRIDNGFEGIPVPGRTDSIILADAAAKWGLQVTPALVAAFQETYYRCLSEALSRLPAGIRGVLPGVVALLEALRAQPNFSVGLLTGNYSVSAKIKLDRFGLWHYFPFGAFGEDASERADLVRVAIGRARAAGVPHVPVSDVVVVGDTPLDVACALANGARVLGVATGSYSVKDLEAAGAHKSVETLEDAEGLIDWIAERPRRNGEPVEAASWSAD